MDPSNDTTACSITLTQAEFYVTFSWWLSGIGTLCFAGLGIAFNTIAIYVLCDKRMISSFFNRLLVCLAIVDNLFLTNAISVVIVENFVTSNSESHISLFVNLLYPTRNMLMCMSIYMTVSLACERFNSVSNPILYRTRQTTNTCYRLLLYIIPVITFSVVYNIPKFFDLKVSEITSNCKKKWPNDTIQSNCTTTTEYIMKPTKLRENDDYILWYINISNLVVTAAIPVILLTFFNYKIYTSLKQRKERKAAMVSQTNNSNAIEKDRNKKEVRQTFILFAIVALFVICQSLRIILNIEEFVNLEKRNQKQNQGCIGKEFWSVVSIPIAGLLIQINSGTNFFIYCAFSDFFREVLTSKLMKKWPSNQRGLFTQLTTRENIELHEVH